MSDSRVINDTQLLKELEIELSGVNPCDTFKKLQLEGYIDYLKLEEIKGEDDE
tara:strand:+ start:28 stop:186 length:159 start_codon:yes stop_codon:yes gene_type:complete